MEAPLRLCLGRASQRGKCKTSPLSLSGNETAFPLHRLAHGKSSYLPHPTCSVFLQNSKQWSPELETFYTAAARDINRVGLWSGRRKVPSNAVSLPSLSMLRFVIVEQDVALGIMTLINVPRLECLILAHTWVHPNSLLNPDGDPLWLLGPFIGRQWPNLPMLALRGMVLRLESMLPLFALLEDLEVLDICEFNKHQSVLPKLKAPLLPNLALLRANPNTAQAIEKLTRGNFRPIERHHLNLSALLQVALTWGGQAKWHIVYEDEVDAGTPEERAEEVDFTNLVSLAAHTA